MYYFDMTLVSIQQVWLESFRGSSLDNEELIRAKFSSEDMEATTQPNEPIRRKGKK